MEITNEYDLNPLLMKWLTKNEYDYHPGIYSATTLLRPMRQVLLYERHWDEMVCDASDLIKPRWGDAWHDSMEKALKDEEGIEVEKRLYGTMKLGDREVKISGKFDALQINKDGTMKLYDHKSTSVWKWIKEETEDWIFQLSVYRWLIAQNYETVPNDIAEINLLFTDWQRKKAKLEDNYPPIPAGSMEIELKSLDEIEKEIRERLEDLYKYSEMPDDELPFCSDKELWAEPDKYAVYSTGSDKCRKLCDTHEEAEQWAIDKHIKNLEIRFRKGKVKRCTYCYARPFCNQYKEMLEEGRIAEE